MSRRAQWSTRLFMALVGALLLFGGCASRRVLPPDVFNLGSHPVEGVGMARIGRDVPAARREAKRVAVQDMLSNFGMFNLELSELRVVDGQHITVELFRSLATQVLLFHIDQPMMTRERVEKGWYMVYVGMSDAELEENLRATHRLIEERKKQADLYVSRARDLPDREAELRQQYVDQATSIYEEIGCTNPELLSERTRVKESFIKGAQLFTEVERLTRERRLDDAEQRLAEARLTLRNEPRYEALRYEIDSRRTQARRLELAADMKRSGRHFKEAMGLYDQSLAIHYRDNVVRKFEQARHDDSSTRRRQIRKFFIVTGVTAGLAGLGYYMYLENKKLKEQGGYWR